MTQGGEPSEWSYEPSFLQTPPEESNSEGPESRAIRRLDQVTESVERWLRKGPLVSLNYKPSQRSLVKSAVTDTLPLKDDRQLSIDSGLINPDGKHPYVFHWSGTAGFLVAVDASEKDYHFILYDKGRKRSLSRLVYFSEFPQSPYPFPVPPKAPPIERPELLESWGLGNDGLQLGDIDALVERLFPERLLRENLAKFVPGALREKASAFGYQAYWTDEYQNDLVVKLGLTSDEVTPY